MTGLLASSYTDGRESPILYCPFVMPEFRPHWIPEYRLVVDIEFPLDSKTLMSCAGRSEVFWMLKLMAIVNSSDYDLLNDG
jgi:hypothetical protein